MNFVKLIVKQKIQSNPELTLLGRERVGKCDGATWCELGGSVKIGESFLESAIRESKEESGDVYPLEPNDLLNNGVVCYNEHKQKDGLLGKKYMFY